jgi:hypothetical protein
MGQGAIMKNFITIAAASFAGVVLALAANPALAHTDVEVNIGVPGVFVQPEPVYVQPRPVYVEPAPVYVRPAPVYIQPQPYYVERQQREWRERQWHEAQWRQRQWREHQWRERQMYWQRDNDRDGIPNRFDRHPYNPYRN